MPLATIFEPRLAIIFATVVREGSITAAARVLGLAQPWISEQVRKLELELGETLLIRTSRRMELTEAGRRFLPLADTLADANRAAQAHAAELRAVADRRVRIGATDFTMGLEERLLLIDRYLARNPRAELEIVGGKPSDLIRQLAAGDLDIALVHRQGIAERGELAQLPLGPRFGHLLAPPDHRLAALDEIPLAALANEIVAVSPGRTDAVNRRIALEPLRALGVQFVPAPDENRESIAAFAARQRMLCFWWYRGKLPRHLRGQQVCIPVEGHPLVTELAVVKRRKDLRGKIQRMWSAAEDIHLQGYEVATGVG